MLPGRFTTFSNSMTCMISEPRGGSRSCLDWASLDEQTCSDFQNYGSRFDQFEKEADELAQALEQYTMGPSS